MSSGGSGRTSLVRSYHLENTFDADSTNDCRRPIRTELLVRRGGDGLCLQVCQIGVVLLHVLEDNFHLLANP